MKNTLIFPLLFPITFFSFNCASKQTLVSTRKTAAEILGNPEYTAISYGGFRHGSRNSVPSVSEIKEDLAIMAAINIKVVRTYNTQQFAHASNLLKAIREMKTENPKFEMYVMLGAWIDCENAWTPNPIHHRESFANNTAEIEAAIKMANEYPDIVKIIAVGNEAMVRWAASYYVTPNIILKWVNHLQDLKKANKLPADLWITSSDNFASWGGEDKSYHTDDLEALVKAVDYVSIHTYPFHDTHYNPSFWGVPAEEESLSKKEQLDTALLRARDYAKSQYQSVVNYIKSLGIEKPVHIGETGWASVSNSFYGAGGSKAADEYKVKGYYDNMREWTSKAGISCFYFEAFDEPWKDANNPMGSENHFGLINIKGEAKYALWSMVDDGVFEGLTRGGKPITKTYNGDESYLMKNVFSPPLVGDMQVSEITTVNENRKLGEAVTENHYIISHDEIESMENNGATFPSKKLRLNPWEGTCNVKKSKGIVEIEIGTGDWWGAGIEIQGNGKGENLSNFSDGYLNFDIIGNANGPIEVGFQTGIFVAETQTNNYVTFGPNKEYTLSEEWKTYSLKISDLNNKADLEDVTSLIYLKGAGRFDGQYVFLRNIYYSKK